jgi:hypothetical protein
MLGAMSGSPETPAAELRARVRSALASGILPPTTGQVIALRVAGNLCACCTAQIDALAIHYQVDLPQGKLYAHVACFRAWFNESRRLERSMPPEDQR